MSKEMLVAIILLSVWLLFIAIMWMSSIKTRRIEKEFDKLMKSKLNEEEQKVYDKWKYPSFIDVVKFRGNLYIK